MRLTTCVLAGVLSGGASMGYACTLPKLAVIPPKAEVAGKEAAIHADANRYFTEMQAYTTCLQADLTSAGGDAAPDMVRRVLFSRAQSAVAEAEFMMKLFTENVAPAVTPPTN